MAIYMLEPKMVDILLSNGADATPHNYLCETIEQGKANETLALEISKNLIAHGTTTSSTGCSTTVTYPGKGTSYINITPLSLAISVSNQRAIQFLLTQPRGIEPSGLSAPFFAASKGKWKLTEQLIKSDKDLDGALIGAIIARNSEMAKKYLARGANPNIAAMDLMVYAIMQKDKMLIDALLKHGYNATRSKPRIIKNYTHTIVTDAIDSGDYEILKTILMAGATPNAGKYSNPLCKARNQSSGSRLGPEKALQMMNLLLAAGADTNLPCMETHGDGKYVSTPLIKTVLSDKDIELSMALLAAGADPDLKDYEGNTALHQADPKATALLITMGANIEARNKKGETPLHSAASREDAKKASILLRAGADVNAKETYYGGETPMDKILNGDGKPYDEQTYQVLRSYGGTAPYTAKMLKKKNSGGFAKLFATAAITGMAASANISAADKSRVMSAMVNDIWVNDGKGNELGNMYKESVTNGKGSGNGNPILDSMNYTRDQQQVASQTFKKEMAKNQAHVQQQGAINKQHNMVAGSSVASSSTFSAPSVNTAPEKCTSITPPLSTHALPTLSTEGKDHSGADGAESTLLRETNDHMQSICGNKNYRVEGQPRPSFNRDILEKGKMFNRVSLSIKGGQRFSCLCTPGESINSLGRGVAK
jgi:ankyrin repeat protein